MDVESERAFAIGTPIKQHSDRIKSRRRRNILLGLAASLVIIIITVIVVLALTLFKAKDPRMTLNSVALRSMSVSMDLPRLRALVNISLDIELTVKNPNRVGFKYGKSISYLDYRGEVVGEAPIPAGKVSSDSSERISFSLTVMADRLATDMNTYRDILNDALPFNMLSDVKGKVKIMNLFRIKVETAATCDFTVFIGNTSLSHPDCKYKTSL